MAPQQFRGVLAVEGQEANGVVLEPGSLTWPESVPLHLGLDGPIIGRVEQIERAGAEVRGELILETEVVGVQDGEPFAFELDDNGGVVGFGLAAHVSFADESKVGTLTAVAVTADPAFPAARALRVPVVRAVWKFELGVDDEQFVAMPAGAELLYAGTQRPRDPSRVTLWARVLPCGPEEFVKRRILIRGTGHPIADEPYVGTVVFPADGGVVSLVWHVFDGGES